MIPIFKPSTPQDSQHYIVNLSSIHQLKPLPEVLNQFAELHYQYAQSWLGKWYSKLWVRLKYLTLTGSINDYKLGKIKTDTFISKLQEIFYFIPADKNPKGLLESAWNSLIHWDNQSTQRLNYLIEKNQPVYLVSNTNELNIQKIKQDVDMATEKKWKWQGEARGECKFQTYDNFKLMTSYENKEFKTDGLIENWVKQLLIEGKVNENIILVSQYQADLDKARKLGIRSEPASQFFPTIPVEIASQASALLNNGVIPTPLQVSLMPMPNNLDTTSRQGANFFTSVNSSHPDMHQDHSEASPLLAYK